MSNHISDGIISRRSAMCITVQTIHFREFFRTRFSDASVSGSDQYIHS